MNQDLLYTLDPYIIGILFKLKTDEDVLKTYNMLLEDTNKIMQETFKEFLIENKFTEQEIDELLSLDDFEKANPKFKPYLQNIILINRVEANIKELLKAYYDVLIPKLTEQEKTDLEKYLKENEELLEQKRKIVLDSLGIIKKVLEDNKVETVAELEKKIGPIPVEEVADVAPTEQQSVPSSAPSINLGGVTTGGMDPDQYRPVSSSPVNGQESSGNKENSEVASVEPAPIQVDTVEPTPIQIDPMDTPSTEAMPSGPNIVDMAKEASGELPQAPTQDVVQIAPQEASENLPVPPVPNYANDQVEVSSSSAVDQPLMTSPTGNSGVLDNTLPPLPQTEVVTNKTPGDVSGNIAGTIEMPDNAQNVSQEQSLAQPMVSSVDKLNNLGIGLDNDQPNTQQ